MNDYFHPGYLLLEKRYPLISGAQGPLFSTEQELIITFSNRLSYSPYAVEKVLQDFLKKKGTYSTLPSEYKGLMYTLVFAKLKDPNVNFTIFQDDLVQAGVVLENKTEEIIADSHLKPLFEYWFETAVTTTIVSKSLHAFQDRNKEILSLFEKVHHRLKEGSNYCFCFKSEFAGMLFWECLRGYLDLESKSRNFSRPSLSDRRRIDIAIADMNESGQLTVRVTPHALFERDLIYFQGQGKDETMLFQTMLGKKSLGIERLAIKDAWYEDVKK